MYEFTARKDQDLVVGDCCFRDLLKVLDKYGEKGFVITIQKKVVDETKNQN